MKLACGLFTCSCHLTFVGMCVTHLIQIEWINPAQAGVQCTQLNLFYIKITFAKNLSKKEINNKNIVKTLNLRA
jgi:hypothetical protein